jgi:hypothetical protein
MKVRELIEKLQKLDGNLDVICSTEDENFLAQHHFFRLLDITSVDVAEGEKCRGSDGLVSLKLGHSSLSQKQVIIEVTGSF